MRPRRPRLAAALELQLLALVPEKVHESRVHGRWLRAGECRGVEA